METGVQNFRREASLDFLCFSDLDYLWGIISPFTIFSIQTQFFGARIILTMHVCHNYSNRPHLAGSL